MYSTVRESAEGRRGRARFTYLSAITAIALLVYLVALPPHFVHHLFQPHHKQAQCVVASSAEHTPQALAETVSLVPADSVEFAEPVTDAACVPTLARAFADTRAPPLPPTA